MKANKEDKKCGIYCIKNIINGKVYVGKSKNIYKRIHQHLYDLRNNRIKNENSYLLNSWNKYGNENFEYFVLEFLEIDENLVKNRELYWMNKLNSLNREFGYNLRQDSSTNMITNKETSLKISNRLKDEWSSGIREKHSEKLSKNWNENPNRKIIQSKIMKTNLTKYKYKIYTLDNKYLGIYDYSKLVEFGFKSVLSTFQRSKLDKVQFKLHLIERIKIEDIVRSSQKCEKNIVSNNYIAITTKGKVKYKGAFEIDKDYHKDNSFKIIPIAISNFFVNGTPIEETIRNHDNLYDYCGRQKFKGKDYGTTSSIVGDRIVTEEQQKNVRYYISNRGSSFIKNYAKGSNEVINKGYLVTIYNKHDDKHIKDINWHFYEKECYKEINNIIKKQLTLF